MESTQNPSSDFINNPPDLNVPIDDSNNRLELSLSCHFSEKKRKQSPKNPEPASLSPHKKIKNTELLGPQETITELSLGPTNRFLIKKVLEEGDLNGLSRVVLCREAVERHAIAYWPEEDKERLESREGVAVRVFDSDIEHESEYDMKMRLWRHKNCMILYGQWVGKFVKRRGLKRGCQIGLYWDKPNSRFVFSVLRRVDHHHHRPKRQFRRRIHAPQRAISMVANDVNVRLPIQI